MSLATRMTFDALYRERFYAAVMERRQAAEQYRLREEARRARRHEAFLASLREASPGGGD